MYVLQPHVVHVEHQLLFLLQRVLGHWLLVFLEGVNHKLVVGGYRVGLLRQYGIKALQASLFHHDAAAQQRQQFEVGRQPFNPDHLALLLIVNLHAEQVDVAAQQADVSTLNVHACAQLVAQQLRSQRHNTLLHRLRVEQYETEYEQHHQSDGGACQRLQNKRQFFLHWVQRYE